MVKALVYPPLGVDDKRTDEPASGLAIPPEYLCQGGILLLKVNAGVNPNPMVHEVCGGEEGAGGESKRAPQMALVNKIPSNAKRQVKR